MIPDHSGDLSGTRLLLVHPGIYDEWRARDYPPWGLLYVGAACRKRGAEVHVADLNGENVAPQIRELVAEIDPTVVGVLAKLGKGAERMRQAVDTITALSEVPVGVGGPLVALFPGREHELWTGARAVFQGDGEVAFPDWIAAGCPKTGTVLGPQANLDVLGLPTWWNGLGEYVSDGAYWPGLNVRSVHVSGARGCTRRCTFCYLTSQQPDRSFRVLSPERLVGGCDALHAQWGAEGFYFVDDCLLRPGHSGTERLFNLLISRGAPYRFGCDVQLHELADAGFLRRMWAAGFRSLYVGVESASTTVRKRLGKGRVAEPVHVLLRRALQLGFIIRASIGVGWPGETEEEMWETVKLVRSVPDLMIDAFRYTPLPGAPLSTFWSRQRGLPTPQDPFVDYSEFGRNYSDLPDGPMDAVWEALRAVEAERHGEYFLAT